MLFFGHFLALKLHAFNGICRSLLKFVAKRHCWKGVKQFCCKAYVLMSMIRLRYFIETLYLFSKAEVNVESRVIIGHGRFGKSCIRSIGPITACVNISRNIHCEIALIEGVGKTGLGKWGGVKPGFPGTGSKYIEY